MQRFLLICFLCLLGFNVTAQQPTETKQDLPDSVMEKQHSPTKATILSMCLPGLGQIYNKKYWKVPIIYAGIGVLTYLIIFNTDNYLTYKCAYIESSHQDSTGNYSEIVKKYSLDNIASQREYYRRNLEVTIIFAAVWYGLNILDAAVDAHLFTFNISNDLSLKVEPTLIPPHPRSSSFSTGVRLCLKF